MTGRSLESAGRGRNRLGSETSPYLLQHAGNPVDWHPWGDEAFARARAEDKPLLLSIGYSSCHWCHVMARESFEDEEIAALMNEGFVNVKVDREERPDVDSVYMTATQALTGAGGWPMTVFLTPDGRPFYAGTYFPPDDGHGRPGFRRVLAALREAWASDRGRVLESASDITARLRAATERAGGGPDGAGGGAPDAAAAGALAERAAVVLREGFDDEWGGFGHAPKFPNPGVLEFLLMHGARTGATQPPALRTGQMALATLRAMAAGGIYDHLGGGFARYSVDRMWLVPHFEKMLYDNAQLARACIHAHQLEGDPFFARVARETLDYLAREMLGPEGGFYSAQDADSEGVEGKYFVWTPAEVEAVLGAEDARLCCLVYGIDADGNFEDPHHPEFGRRSVLSRRRDLAAAVREAGLGADALEARLPAWRAALLAAREERTRPGLDDKALASWNGLALAAFAEAGRVLGEERYAAIARRNAEFVRRTLWRGGRLLHTWRAGVAKVDGLLDDYACYGLGLVELYKATGEDGWLRWAAELFGVLVARFRDGGDGAFFESASDAERLILRPKPFFDAATPSGNGAAALLAFWLGRYLGRPEWEAMAREVVGQAAAMAGRAAGGFGSILQAAELLAAPPREIAIVGDPAARAPFERELARRYLPTALIAPAAGGEGLPVLEGRAAPPGEAAAWVCEDFVCGLPARSAAELAAQLGAPGG